MQISISIRSFARSYRMFNKVKIMSQDPCLLDQYLNPKQNISNGGCFSDPLPTIDNITKLSEDLCETMVRFNNSPNLYTRSDYNQFIGTVTKALFHLYQNGGGTQEEGIGIRLKDGPFVHGSKYHIESSETLLIPEGFEMVTTSIKVLGTIDLSGKLTII